MTTLRCYPTIRHADPLDIWISPFPTAPLETPPPQRTLLAPLSAGVVPRALRILRSSLKESAPYKLISRNRNPQTLCWQLYANYPPGYKEAWLTLLREHRFTHFCTLTLTRNLARYGDCPHKILRNFSKLFCRLLLGRNYAKPTKREHSPLIIAFQDTGSDAKTAKKLQRQLKGREVRNHIRFGKTQALHFHLVLRLTPDHLTRIESKYGTLQTAVQRKWTETGQTSAKRRNDPDNASNPCGSALTDPIRNETAVFLYCLKNL